MKCPEINIHSLLDNEIDLHKKQEIETHLAVCNSCSCEFQAQVATRKLLKQQPAILPGNTFDNSVLQAFENRQVKSDTVKISWSASLFVIPKRILAFGVVMFLVTAGLAFQIGRLSVSSPPHINLAKTTDKTPRTKPTAPTKVEKRKIIPNKPKIKTITKYIKVPVIKEKIVYINNPVQKSKKTNEIEKQNKQPIAAKNVAAQFNLKDLQPVTKVTYRIIRKGGNNEK